MKLYRKHTDSFRMIYSQKKLLRVTAIWKKSTTKMLLLDGTWAMTLLQM